MLGIAGRRGMTRTSKLGLLSVWYVLAAASCGSSDSTGLDPRPSSTGDDAALDDGGTDDASWNDGGTDDGGIDGAEDAAVDTGEGDALGVGDVLAHVRGDEGTSASAPASPPAIADATTSDAAGPANDAWTPSIKDAAATVDDAGAPSVPAKAPPSPEAGGERHGEHGGKEDAAPDSPPPTQPPPPMPPPCQVPICLPPICAGRTCLPPICLPPICLRSTCPPICPPGMRRQDHDNDNDQN
jgi:hypothetical protein